MTYANELIAAGQQDQVRNLGLWTGDDNNLHGGSIAWDLDFVADNYDKIAGCDLWEEVRSDDFFWNK